MTRAASVFGVALLVALSGCGSPDSLHILSGRDITVEVRADPYGLTVRDGSGRVVLASRDGGGDDFAPLGWAAGQVQWRRGLLPGYYEFSPALAPWHRAGRVTSVERDGARLTVVISGDGPPIRVVHELRDATLRVQAELSEPPPAGGAAPRAWHAAFSSPPNEAFLGFGERFNRTNQRGVDVFSFAEEGGVGGTEAEASRTQFPSGEPMTYFPVPFFVSTAGYGFWLDTTWRSEFNLATADPDAFRAWHTGPTLAFEVYLPHSDDSRPFPQQLVDRFTAATGRPLLPPAWTFGPRRRINRGTLVGGVPEFQAMRQQDLAITALDDALHFLPGGSHLGSEAALRSFTASARALGYRVNGYYNSLFAKEDTPLQPVVDEGLASGYFLRDRTGAPSEVFLISGRPLVVYQLDFTAPRAVTFYQRMFSWATELGYSGWMYDFGEYVQPDTQSASGMSGEELHNLYPVLYDKAVHDAMEASPRKGDWLAFARAGYTGSWRYIPMFWSGDPSASFDSAIGLPAMVRAGINLGLSGAPHWGSDIGGFKCVPGGSAKADGELLTRWIQLGAMSSNMQDQDACALNMDGGHKATIWTSPDAKEAWRTYARLHTRLFPYLYALAQEASRTGAPTMRHLLFEHPERVDLAAVDDTFYLGPTLLVAPVVHRGERQRAVELPLGLYLDWRDQRLLEGGRQVTLDAPLDKLPLLLRDGHLLPLLDPRIDTLDDGDHSSAPAGVDVIGPREVADVYDVVGLLSLRTGRAAFTLADGGRLEASFTGGLDLAALRPARDDADLASCTGCYRDTQLAMGLRRLRVSLGEGSVKLGGLDLLTKTGRRVRWDLYLVEK